MVYLGMFPAAETMCASPAPIYHWQTLHRFKTKVYSWNKMSNWINKPNTSCKVWRQLLFYMAKRWTSVILMVTIIRECSFIMGWSSVKQYWTLLGGSQFCTPILWERVGIISCVSLDYFYKCSPRYKNWWTDSRVCHGYLPPPASN